MAPFLVGLSGTAMGVLAGDTWLGFGVGMVSMLIYEITFALKGDSE